ncbi:MAG: DUF3500 domain-containing protein [Planctomycetaceae bacterium]|nr:DUF3500 domain-containing protein [Planctomycetaceae bacterium]
MPRHARKLLLFVLIALTPVAAWAVYRTGSTGESMSDAAAAWIVLLNDEQKKTALLSFDDDAAQRVDWHFIPKEHRKGLQIKQMTPEQRAAALTLLRTALSETGYDKAKKIMSMERLLAEIEKNGRFLRDPERYYFTIFGAELDGRWGLSVEGHHLSLNFVVQDGKVIASTPQLFAANPAEVKTENKSGFPLGTRILAKEELLAFELVNGLDDTQHQSAVIDEKAPSEIRAAGEAHPPVEPAAGITAARLTSVQQALLRELIGEYVRAVPTEIAEQRMAAIDEAGFDNVHFAWAGPTKPGIGHYYRVQGPTFLIEFVNTQPDVAGNPANHIHSVWRDLRGDFGIPVAAR